MPDEDDDMWIWQLIDITGHLDCGGWSYDGYTGRLVCRCTARLYKSALVTAI